MCEKSQIVVASDVVTKLPDELPITPDELKAIATVLGLLGALMQQKTAH